MTATTARGAAARSLACARLTSRLLCLGWLVVAGTPACGGGAPAPMDDGPVESGEVARQLFIEAVHARRLSLHVEGGLQHPQAFTHAVERWQRLLPCVELQVVPAPDPLSVRIFHVEPGTLGGALGRYDPEGRTIALDEAAWAREDSSTVALLVSMHELGHALGSAHVEDPLCLMHANAGAGGLSVCQSTLDRLRELWCPVATNAL